LQSVNSKITDTKTDIRHKGFVKKVLKNSLIITIISESACSTCHAKGACTVADHQDKEIEITHFTKNYSVGDEIVVIFQESKGFVALLWGYVLPFFLVLLTLVLSLEITQSEFKAGILSLIILIPYYITLYFFRHLLKKVFKFEVEEIN